jgi:peptidoglycan/LPS O-acetylase OafA/YrhL
LIHFVVLCSISSFLYVKLPQTHGFLAINFLIYMAISVGCAIIFTSLVDKKAIDLSHRFASAVLPYHREKA